MGKRNERGAGRKQALTEAEIAQIKARRDAGETLTALAQDYMMRMDFMCKEECCTQILVDFRRERIEIVNTTDDIIHRAFGIKAKPTWEDFMEFLESRCFPRTRDQLRVVLKELELDFYDPLAIVEKTKGRMAEDFQWLQITYFEPKK